HGTSDPRLSANQTTPGNEAQMDHAGVLWRVRPVSDLLPDAPLFPEILLAAPVRQPAFPNGRPNRRSLRLLLDSGSTHHPGGNRPVSRDRDDLARSGQSPRGASPARLVDVSDLALCLDYGRYCVSDAVPTLSA